MKIHLSDCETIKNRQRAWANRTGLTYDADGYCLGANDNIFQGLSPGARKEFESGDGESWNLIAPSMNTTFSPFIIANLSIGEISGPK